MNQAHQNLLSSDATFNFLFFSFQPPSNLLQHNKLIVFCFLSFLSSSQCQTLHKYAQEYKKKLESVQSNRLTQANTTINRKKY